MDLIPIARRIQSLIPPRWQGAARLTFCRARSVFYRGDAVFCPMCGHSSSRFLHVGKPPRPAACPRCDSRERHRLLWLYLTNETDIFTAPKKVLHFAPEDWLQRTLSKIPTLDYVSGDLSSPAAMLRLDIMNLDLPDESFDVVLCSHVLEHVPDDRRAMRELYRVTRRGGFVLVQVPVDRSRAATYEDPSIVDPEERFRAFGQEDHVRYYGLDLPQRLREAGFAVTAIPYARGKDSRRLGLDPEEEIYRCERR